MKQSSLMRAGAVLAGLAALTVVGSAGGASVPDGDWLGFGRSADNMRHSPLTEVTPANVKTLARAYMIDFRKVDPDVRRGEQSYPVAIDGQLYVTTNDDNVFRIDGATGNIVWHFKPKNSGLFKNFGIVANRGVTACDGKLFLLTLDMPIDALDPGTGQLIKSVPIADAVPGRRLELRLLRDERPDLRRPSRGVRRRRLGVRHARLRHGLHHEPRAGLAEPVLDDPARAAELAQREPHRRRRQRVDAGDRRRVDRHRVLRHRVGHAAVLPVRPPGAQPAHRLAHRGRPEDRRHEVVAAADRGNQWAYDVSQPPLVYDAKVGGTTRHVVSVASMEGVWYAFDAKTGRPIYQRIKVIDRVEHPSLQPGKPVTVYPSSLGGLNYSPASYDPDRLRVQRRLRDRLRAHPGASSRRPRRSDKFVLGDVFIGVDNGNFGHPAGLARPRIDQRDRRRERPARCGSSTRRSPSAAASRRPRRDSASPVAATAWCGPSTCTTATCCGRARPDRRSPRGRPCSAPVARSTSR